MNEFDAELGERLEALRAQGLYRELRQVESPQCPHIRLAGRDLLNFSSNDYLGLANEPALKAAAVQAIERYGAGTGASRLICGSLSPHHELEEALASFKGTGAALSFSSGYATALGTICALMGSEDIVVLDKLVHASIVDAARLCGAKLRVFAHNDLEDLERILKWADTKVQSPSTVHSPQSTVASPATTVRTRKSRVLVITESVFSMDGDQAPLREMVALKEKYGAWLMVDEAHSTGLYGANRRGWAEELGVGEHIEIQMGTLGKSFGAGGGYICGSRTLIDYLVNRARAFIFSTAPVPAAAAAAAAGVRLVQSPLGEERRRRLWENVATLSLNPSGRGQLVPATAANTMEETAGTSRPRPNNTAPSAIIPLIVGDEAKAVEIATSLREQGIFIPAVRYPTVPRGTARLRLTLTAAHTAADLQQLTAALRNFPVGQAFQPAG